MTLSRVGEIVRRHDPDRFFTALFAPPDRREALFTLYAFNHELARAREVARESMIALIRLEWWREVVEGARRRHDIAGPLGDALDDGALVRADLLHMIDGREMEAEPIETVAAWREYVLGTAGAVAIAAGHALGGTPSLDGALRHYGAAYGVAGILRIMASPVGAIIPAELLQDASRPSRPGNAEARTTLAAEGEVFLADARRTRIPRPVMPAVLPAALARAELRHPLRTLRRGRLAPKLAVIRSVVSGRI